MYTDKDFLNYRYNDTVPLVLAAQVGCLEVFNYLIEHHANIEAKVSWSFLLKNFSDFFTNYPQDTKCMKLSLSKSEATS